MSIYVKGLTYLMTDGLSGNQPKIIVSGRQERPKATELARMCHELAACVWSVAEEGKRQGKGGHQNNARQSHEIQNGAPDKFLFP